MISKKYITLALIFLGVVQVTFSVLDTVDGKDFSGNSVRPDRKMVSGLQEMSSILKICRSNREVLQEDSKCAHLQEFLNKGRDKVFCRAVEEAGVIKGYVAGINPTANRRNPEEGHIHHLVVSEGSCRQGLGSLLLGEAENVVSNMGGNKVSLALLKSNVKVLGFYSRFGYRFNPNVMKVMIGLGSNDCLYLRKELVIND
jgi:ribosomal protein S18 acetylase RimI-like enzyme